MNNTVIKQLLFKGLRARKKNTLYPKRLYIDLDICSGICPGRGGPKAGKRVCRECVVECSYFYHSGNNGIYSVREIAVYCLICRKCEEAHCVNACRYGAIEKQPDNLLIRHGMKCVGCKSCSYACPYGTIYPEVLPYVFSNCDFCLDRRKDKGDPICIPTCPYGALALKDAEFNPDENTFLTGENILVHFSGWLREKA